MTIFVFFIIGTEFFGTLVFTQHPLTARMMKTIALQQLKDNFHTLLQEGELTYYM